MKGHQAEARKSWKGAGAGSEADLLGDVYEKCGETVFNGYDPLGPVREGTESAILAIVKGPELVEQAAEACADCRAVACLKIIVWTALVCTCCHEDQCACGDHGWEFDHSHIFGFHMSLGGARYASL